MSKLINIILTILFSSLLAFYFISATASPDIISLFPLEKYDQKITDWLSPSDPSYTKPLLTPAQQAIRKAELYRHYFGKESPWSADYVNLLFSQPMPQDLQSLETEKINSFTNQDQPADKIGYGANFRPYPEQWLIQIKNNIHLQQFSAQHYDPGKRAIAITNIQGRFLPTDEPHFHSYKLAGSGYPFDNLQAAVIWAGTPLYILGETADRAWSMVLSPGFIGWVKSTDIAKVNNNFVTKWLMASQQNIAAITSTQIAIIDSENNEFRFSGYIGMLFPAIKKPGGIEILIPVADEKQQAHIHHAHLSMRDLVLIPFLPTPQHFVAIMQHLLGRTYGWGGMYFYNDCSGELKSIYTPFGIWLPKHSSDQVDPGQVLGKLDDISSGRPDPHVRSAYLMAQAHPWMTIIHIGGHVLAYLGKYPNPVDPMHNIVPLSYQDMWGLRGKTGPERRAVIGQSVLFPLLVSYPEDADLNSHLNRDTFQLFYLDELPANLTSVNVLNSIKLNLRALLSP